MKARPLRPGHCDPTIVTLGGSLYMMGTSRQPLNRAVSKNVSKKIEIYTTPFCPYCARAKSLLQKKGVPFEEIDVMMAPAKRKEMAERAGGASTVPQIFADGVHIGDCDGIHTLDVRGAN